MTVLLVVAFFANTTRSPDPDASIGDVKDPFRRRFGRNRL